MAHKRRKRGKGERKAGPTHGAAGPASLQTGPTRFLALLLGVAGIWAYSNSLDGAFVLDDRRAIVLNPTLGSVSQALSPPPASTVSGRPVANVSFAISRSFGEGPRPFHITNVAIHLAAALLVFGGIRRTLLSSRMRDRFGGGASLLAFAVAVIWVVHPLTTSAVTYVVQRVESLMSLFYLLTMYAAIRAADLPAEAGSDGKVKRRVWVMVAVVSCALGMATKEVMVTAPVAVALWLWVFEPAMLRRTRLLIPLAATWIVFGVLVYHEHRAPSIATSGEIVWRYLLTQSEVIVHYLRLAFVPTKLVFLYTWPLATSLGDVAGAAATVLAVLAASMFAMSRRHPLGFAGAWFFLLLAPTSSVIPIVTEVAAEHRMYLPLVPLIAAFVGTLCILARKLPIEPLRAAWLCLAIAMCAAVAMGVQTRARNRDYATEETLWRDTVTKDPGNQRARVAYATTLASSGRSADARKEFETAVALNPSDPVAQGRLGHLYGLARQDAAAVEHLQRAYELRPDPVVATELAGVLADSRDPMVRNPAKALPIAEEAVRLTARRDPAAIEVLAVAHAYLGHGPQAVSLMQEAVDVARRTGDPRVSELEQRLQFYRTRTSGR